MATLSEIAELMREGHWKEAHDPVQRDDSALAAWLHGLLHVQEGDLEDAEYWYDRAGRHFRSRGSLAQEIESFQAALAAQTGG
ncbi:hypothetical protein [Ideonella sp. YS5]|uniref:hypothetical protein n=1 Tax=Ideonella sp. YS5 TaxID=3453714 RepID=UPI003EEA1701